MRPKGGKMLTPKKLIRFSFETDLDVKTCKERLSDEYRDLARIKDPEYRYVIARRVLYFCERGDAIRMRIRRNSSNSIAFIVKIADDNKLTKIMCNRCFYFCADVISNLTLLLSFLTLLVIILFFTDGRANFALYGFIPVSCAFVLVFLYNEIAARDIAIDYIKKALEARQVE
jgi:hypothetical protein